MFRSRNVFVQRGRSAIAVAGSVFLCASLFLAGPAHAGTPPLPNINTNLIFDVTNTAFAGGALGNGVSNSAAAIQAAINFASTASASGATVRVRAVGVNTNYLSGPISLKSHVNLLIDAGTKLQMLPMSMWSGTITFINAGTITDVGISGAGTIDGNAKFISGTTTNWWGTNGGSSSTAVADRPNFIQFIHCTRSLVQDVTLQNPPTFHIMAKNNNVSLTIQNITIATAAGSQNTDGMDLGSSNVLIQGCSISCGDDNIEIGGSTAAALDITITNCTFGTGHGVSMGSLVNGAGGGVQDLIVSNCTFNGTDYGIRMKSDRDIGGVCQNLRYLDITMTNVGYAIVIYSYYNSVGTPNSITPFRASTDTVHAVTGTTPIWRNIIISNVTATLTGSSIGGIIWGVPEMLVSNVTLCKVNLAAPTKTFSIYNATGIQIIDSNLTAPNTSTNTLTLFNAQITVTNSAPSANLVTLGGLARPPTNNTFVFFNAKAAITDTNMLGTGSITLGNSTLSFTQTSANSASTPINVVAASTLTVTRGTNTFNGALSGPGPLALNLTNNNIMLTLRGNNSGFTGTLAVTNSGTLRLDQNTNTWGGANAAFDAGASGTINNHSAGSIAIFLGALSGGSGSRLRGSDQTGPGVDTYVIGGLNSNTTFAGVITNGTSATTPHTVALTKIGNGVFTLSGANSYSAGTIVSNGTLSVNNTAGSGTGAGAVTVASGGTLGGSGVIGGPVTINGTLAPGNSPGTLTISNNLVVNGGGALQYDLGTSGDLTVVSGNLTLAGTLNVTDAGGFTNTTYTLFTYGGTLSYSGLTIGAMPNTNFTYAISTNTSGQVKLVVTAPTAFPQWQLQYFACTNCPQAAATADPDGDGQDNQTEFLAGVDPTNSASYWHFQANPTNGLPPVVVTFTENSTGSSITNRLWDFGDGATGTGPNPSHTYTNAGTFSVGLTILNFYGTATLVASNLITVFPEAVWTNANTSGNWSTATSWSPVSIPDFGADVIFADAGATAVVDNVSRTIGGITFDWPGGFSVTALGGAALTVDNGITVTTNSTYTISTPVVLGGTNIWFVTSNGILQVSGPVSGTNSITKTGGGTLILSATNTYSGDTTVSNGTMKVIGTGLITNTPSIDIAAGATLDVSGRAGGNMNLANGQTLLGDGTVSGNLILTDGSVLSPGSPVGTLTFLNDLVVSNAAVLQYDLGAVSDLTAVSNNLVLGGTLDINDAGGFTTGVYTLVTYGGTLTGNGVTIGAVPATNFVYVIDTNTAGQVKLIVAPLPSTVVVTAANLFESTTDNLAPSNSVAVLVADTGNNGFADPSPTASLSVGATWGTDDKVVGLWDLGNSVNCSGNDAGSLCGQTVVPYLDGITPGQSLQLYWFPSLTLSSNTLGVTSYGKYTDQVGIDGSDVWQIPTGDSPLSLIFLTAAYSGSNPETAGLAAFSTAPVAPVAAFTASSTNGVEPLTVTFTDASSGSPLSLSWDLGDSTITNTAGGASFGHTYSAGVYTITLTASNSIGTSTLVSNNLITVVIPAFQAWQLAHFGCTNCAQAAGSADPDGDGLNNTNEFLAGTDPTSSASALRIISAVRQTADVVIAWTTAGGFTNAVQAAPGDLGGSFSTNFVDISNPILIQGSGDATTNYTDTGGATNSPARYYRVRLVP